MGRQPAAQGVRVVVLVAVTAIGLAGCSSGGSKPRGASTPKAAAASFLTAINAGNGSAAAAISCTAFANGARSEARSGADPGIMFSLGAVTATGTTGTAVLKQETNVGGTFQSTSYTLTLKQTGGLWLVCGQA